MYTDAFCQEADAAKANDDALKAADLLRLELKASEVVIARLETEKSAVKDAELRVRKALVSARSRTRDFLQSLGERGLELKALEAGSLLHQKQLENSQIEIDLFKACYECVLKELEGSRNRYVQALVTRRLALEEAEEAGNYTRLVLESVKELQKTNTKLQVINSCQSQLHTLTCYFLRKRLLCWRLVFVGGWHSRRRATMQCHMRLWLKATRSGVRHPVTFS